MGVLSDLLRRISSGLVDSFDSVDSVDSFACGLQEEMRKRGMSAADFRDAEERVMRADVARWRELLLHDLNANSLEPELAPAPGTDRVDGDSDVKLISKATAKTKSSREEHDEVEGDDDERATTTSEGEGEDELSEGCEGAPRALGAMERWPPELRDAWLAATDARTGATPLHVAAAKGYLGVLRCATACIL